MSTGKKITVSEFRFWLQGVEEMQDEGWTPNSQQWSKIREKIDQIVETEQPAPAARPPLQYPQGARQPENRPNATPAQNTMPPPSIPVPVGPSNLQATPQMPRAPRTASTGAGLPVSLSSGQTQAPIRTPDIDTSGGGYDSQFV